MIQTDLKNLIAKIQESFDYDHDKFVMNPDRDWRRLVFLFLIINLSITIFSFYIFNNINTDNIFIVKTDAITNGNTITREKIDSAASYINGKNEELNILLTHKPQIIDPSN